jgi:hypothetical protein
MKSRGTSLSEAVRAVQASLHVDEKLSQPAAWYIIPRIARGTA